MTEHLDQGMHDIPAERYHGDPCPTPGLSAGLAAKMLSATPLHAFTASPRLNPNFVPDEKTAFDIGSAAHELLTGKGRGIWKVDFEDYRTKESRQERDEARAEGYTPLTRPQFEMVGTMIRRAREQMRAHGIGDPFEGGENEMTLLWEQGGIWNRCMVDCLDQANRVAYDFKTCAGVADPDQWLRRSMDHGVDLRAAHYLDGLETVLGGRWTYRFVVQEKEEPHCLSVIELSEDAVFMGRKKIARAREMWGHCLKHDAWPGFSAQIAVVEPAPFWTDKWLDRESREADVKARTGKDILDFAMRMQAPVAAE